VIAALDPRAELCPHPQSRAMQVIQVYGRRRAMQVCLLCADVMRGLCDAWDRGQLSPRNVVTAMLALGYGRVDAAKFLLQLVIGR
jgi:hypothetical protein